MLIKAPPPEGYGEKPTLYSFWLITAIGGFGLGILGIGRFLVDTEGADNSDIITNIVGFVVNLVAAITAPNLDFVCTGGAFCVNGVQTYTGMWEFLFVFSAIGITCGVFTFIVILKTRQLTQLRQSVARS